MQLLSDKAGELWGTGHHSSSLCSDIFHATWTQSTKRFMFHAVLDRSTFAVWFFPNKDAFSQLGDVPQPAWSNPNSSQGIGNSSRIHVQLYEYVIQCVSRIPSHWQVAQRTYHWCYCFQGAYTGLAKRPNSSHNMNKNAVRGSPEDALWKDVFDSNKKDNSMSLTSVELEMKLH